MRTSQIEWVVCFGQTLRCESTSDFHSSCGFTFDEWKANKCITPYWCSKHQQLHCIRCENAERTENWRRRPQINKICNFYKIVITFVSVCLSVCLFACSRFVCFFLFLCCSSLVCFFCCCSFFIVFSVVFRCLHLDRNNISLFGLHVRCLFRCCPDSMHRKWNTSTQYK